VHINFYTKILPIQLPDSMCDLNYTLLVEDEHGDVIKNLGPFLHVGSSVVKEAIVITDLKGNQDYSLTVRVGLHSQVAKSNKHYFSKPLLIIIALDTRCTIMIAHTPK
jgi:hypothetical protein